MHVLEVAEPILDRIRIVSRPHTSKLATRSVLDRDVVLNPPKTCDQSSTELQL